MEKRFCHRVEVNDGTCILNKRGFLRGAKGTVENISLGGIFVRSDFPVKVKDTVRMTVFLPRDSGRINVDTKVVRIEDRGIAFKYTRLDHDDFRILQSFLRPGDVRYF